MKYFFLILFLSAYLHLAADNPPSDAVFEQLTTEYTLHSDGSITEHQYKKVKINTHFAFNRLYGETFIVYDPEYQELKINRVQTTMSDGNVVEAPFNAFNEVLPRFAAGAPAYNRLREMVVTHPGLEVGAVIELDYTLTTKPGYYPGLMVDEILTQSSPIKERTISVTVPEKTTLHYRVLNLRTAPEEKQSEKGRHYTFRFQNIPESTHEGNQPSSGIHHPRLYFSTVTFQEALESVTGQDAFQLKVMDAMTERITQIKEEAKSDMDVVLVVQKMIAGDLNNWSVPMGHTGYRIRTPIETWNSNGGTTAEKTLLMAALLREAGINANPVLVIPSKLYDKSNGCLPLVENILLQVNPRETEQMYLSATETNEQNLIYSLNGRTILLAEPTKNYVERIDEQFENKVITNGDIIFNDDLSYSGSIEIALTEQTNPYYHFRSDSSYAKKLIGGGVSAGNVLESEIINTAQYRTLAQIKIENKKTPEDRGGYFFWEIPINRNGTGNWRISYLLPERVEPFEVPGKLDEEYSYTLTLPDNVKLVNETELTEKETDFGKLILSVTQKDNKVVIKRLFELNETWITPENYAAFKEMMDLWNDDQSQKLVFKTGSTP
jgi:hypothetical protein